MGTSASADARVGGSSGSNAILGSALAPGSPRTSRTRKPRRPRPGNEIEVSPLRPHVLAEERLVKWKTQAGLDFRTNAAKMLKPGMVDAIFEVMRAGLEPKTASNYGAGLLRFTQLCDEMGIPEALRIPAPEHLLAALVARHAGTVQAKTIGSWLSGLRIYHALNGAEWRGESILKYTKKGAVKMNPPSLPKRPPVTIEHMQVLVNGLDLSNTFDVAVFAVACTAFWGCRRLGEVVIPSAGTFDPERHVGRDAKVAIRTISLGVEYLKFHIPWTKCTGREGADVILTRISGFLDPVTALQHHLRTNARVPSTAPLFSFESGHSNGWEPMTRDWFITRCNEVWTRSQMENVTGHCFRIGGATELLLRGTHPDVVATLGSWKSKAFLEYWRKIESIIPLFIARASDSGRVQLMRDAMERFDRSHR